MIGADGADRPAALEDLQEELAAWLSTPIRPDMQSPCVRPEAYQRFVVMRYIDNLIEWGDWLFRQETLESLNEAAQFYILAAELLGRRPEQVDVTAPRARTAAAIFDEPMEEPDSLGAPTCHRSAEGAATAGLFSFGSGFCVPVNERLLTNYWDRVEDRLFKIRHRLDIEGRFRQLPLFEPPIDPGAFDRRAAAGRRRAGGLAGLNVPPPHYRYEVLVQRAFDLCGEVRSLGAALLSAMERRDGEAQAALKAGHEVALGERVIATHEQRIRETEEALEASKVSQASARIGPSTTFLSCIRTGTCC